MKLLSSFWLALVLVAINPAVTSAQKPDIVVIIVDDLGYGDLSSYGARDLMSPNIDALMDSGMRFNRFYANCPVCSPTRAALLTGRYQDLVGVPGVIRTHPENSWGYLAEGAVLLPQILHQAGYHTGIVGKWHLGLEPENQPTQRGFDHFQGFLGDMMDDYYTHLRHGNHYLRMNETPVEAEGHATDVFTRWAIEFITQQSGTREPFFLYLAYNAPHTPIQPPVGSLARVLTREKGIDPKRAALVALIEHLDEGIGKVIEALRDTGQWENTLLFFVSDNGGQLDAGASNGDLRGGKQDMYEGGIRVPMCAVWPEKIKPGTRTDFVAATMDIFPTTAAAAGATVSHEIDGQSFLPLLLGEEQQAFERDLFFSRREGGERYMGECIWAIRRGDWKLLKNGSAESWELYNLKEDPQETTDLSRKARGKFGELAAAMRVQIQRGGAVPWQKQK